MNQKNTDLFFGDEESNVVLTLEGEDGESVSVSLLASFEIEELGTEYIISAELEDDEETMTGEMQLLKYEEDADGEPVISSIDDEEEYAIAAEACKQILKSGAVEGFALDEDEEDEDDAAEYDEDYLSDIGTIFPGLSIDKDGEIE